MAKAMSPDEFYKKLGAEDKRIVKNLTEKKPIEYIPTGSWVINSLIGDGTGTHKPGGLPRGHIVEVFGDESCGKTTLGVSAAIQAQALNGIVVWADYERTFHREYAAKMGLDLDPKRFIFIEPDNFEQGVRMIYQALPMKPMLIVVDSVSAMIPKQFLEGKIDEGGRIGLQAQLMSMSLNYLTKFLPEANPCLLFLNQLRSVIKKSQYEGGPDEETSGGRALKFYSSVRIRMKKSTVEKIPARSRITGKADKEAINVMVRVTVIKNKIDSPYKTGPLYIRFGEGFDNISSVIELAVNTNVIKKNGAILKFEQGGKQLFSVSGKEQLRRLLEEKPDLLKTLSSSLVYKEDEEVKVQEEATEDNGDELENLLEQASEGFVKNKKEKAEKATKKKDGDVESTD